MTERHVQAIWYDAKLRPRNLVTRQGRRVDVLSPGEWNLEAGPDFRNAVLEIDGARRLVGDVEVHLCPSDWDLHGHGSDSRYRNVIAHVTWGCGPDPSTLPAGAVTIWLGRFMTEDPAFSPRQIDLTAYPYASLPIAPRPCEDRLSHDPDRVRSVLVEAGRHRLRMKARRLVGRLCAETRGRRQVFYEETMTAFGYKRNAAQFRHVAEMLPVEDLPSDPELASRAMLYAGCFEEWDRTGVRPWNAPERRLACAGAVFVDSPLMSFSDAADFSEESCRRMVRKMTERRRMGRGRAAAILTNVIAPFALAEERIADIPDWLPPEDISAPVRMTAFRLLGRDHNPAVFYAGNGLLIQGLLQVHRDYCLQMHPDCAGCGFGAS